MKDNNTRKQTMKLIAHIFEVVKMQNWIIQIMNQFGYAGIALLIAIENIFPPIPSEVILTFGGFMTTYTSMKIWGVILSATIGSVFGAILLYGVGRWLTPEKLERWLEGKWGKMLHFKKEDVSRAAKWFSKKGKPAVFFCRFIPIVRSLISIPAGIARMSMISFLILTTAGTCIWNIVLVYLGVFAGEGWQKIVGYIGAYSMITLIVICILVVITAIAFYKKRFSQKSEHGSNEE
jgi:membrane protein DedA with SNARE-associated domain